MSICNKCGGVVEIRWVGGCLIPIHLSGTCGVGSPYGGRHFETATEARRFEDVCHPTRCPHCSCDVFFIRHNGGSVYVDHGPNMGVLRI